MGGKAGTGKVLTVVIGLDGFMRALVDEGRWLR
jgi:hypothetical protein